MLRSYLRQREMLVQYSAQHIQHMQKALHQMNVKLDKVLSDITGLTGLSIIQAILDGERNPHVLAKFRDCRCRREEAEIAEALRGTWRDEHLFALRQAVTLFRAYQQQMAECDDQIAAHLATMTDKSEGTSLPEKKKVRGKRRNEPGFDARGSLHRVTGVDLTRIDGLDGHSVLKIIGEIGTDMSRWQSVKHFTSWLGLCPGNKQSGGKRLSGRTKRCSNRAAATLRMAASSLSRSQSALGAFLRRMKARLGAPKAITATAHKLARLIFMTLKHGATYVDKGAEWYEQQFRHRMLKSLQSRALQLGFVLVPNTNQI